MQLKVRSVQIRSDIEIMPVEESVNEVEVSAIFIAVSHQQEKIYYAGRVGYRLVNS
ncbi:MAG: hypothetical protein ACI9DH_000394 [Halioglobus sp.]|jgi:hypothetical protein